MYAAAVTDIYHGQVTDVYYGHQPAVPTIADLYLQVTIVCGIDSMHMSGRYREAALSVQICEKK